MLSAGNKWDVAVPVVVGAATGSTARVRPKGSARHNAGAGPFSLAGTAGGGGGSGRGLSDRLKNWRAPPRLRLPAGVPAPNGRRGSWPSGGGTGVLRPEGRS